MAVYKSKDPFRVKPWCADVYKGSTRVKKYFATKEEADIEHATLTLSPVSKKGWDKIKVKDLVEKYRDEISPTKGGAKTEIYRLNYIIDNNPGKTLCGYSLSDLVDQVQGYAYIRAREKQVGGATVSRERNLLQRVFKVACKEWGYVGLTNPFSEITITGSKEKRDRRLEDGEYELLIDTAKKTCHGLNKRYVVLAIDTAIETGMREEEIFRLIWRDVNFDRRTIVVQKSKMDYKKRSKGRTIVLPYRTMVDLVCLKSDIEHYGKTEVKKTDRVFPKTAGSIIQSFERVVERAGIEDLTFRDLRREATSRWGDNEPPLTVPQMKLMDGHGQSDNDINSTYNIPALKEIRRKLDIQALGMTFEEKHDDWLANGWSVYDIIKKIYWHEVPVFRKGTKEKERYFQNLNKLANTPPNEKVKQEPTWKLLHLMAEIQKLGDKATDEKKIELLNNIFDGDVGEMECSIEYRPTIEEKETENTQDTESNVVSIQKEWNETIQKRKLTPRNPNWTMGSK
jgi:integrase